MLTRNLGWKLASLAAACALWLAMAGSKESTMSITAPVQYRNVPTALQISSDMAEQVHVVLRGPSLTLYRLRNGVLPLTIDLSSVRGPGERTFTLTGENLDLPSGVLLERAIPGQIRLTLETRISRRVAVKVRFSNIPEGMKVSSVTTTPEMLTIIGPETRVSRIEEVETDPIDLRMLNARGEAATTAYCKDPHVNFTTSPQIVAHVTLEPADPLLDKRQNHSRKN
jgi:YbbR domain-containing protein